MPKQLHKPAAATATRPVKKARIDVSSVKKRPATPPPQQLKSKSKSAPASAPKVKQTDKAKGKAKAKEPSTTTQGTDASETTSEDLPTTFKIIAGSYEKLLYGLEGTVVPSSSNANSAPGTSTSTSTNPNDALEWDLKPIFIFPAHVSCIKAVSASPQGGKWLATGSADEIIKVWDLRKRKEIGGLMHHQGSITHLTFPTRSHLLSASEDGTLALFHTRDWVVLRTLKGHKGRVNSLAVHPSGKVALSVGKDRALRMWDLMRGKGCASTKLGFEGEVVCWSTDGSKFVVQSGQMLNVYSTSMSLLGNIKHPSRIHAVQFIKPITSDEEFLFVGAEDKKTTIYRLSAAPSPSSSASKSKGKENTEGEEEDPASDSDSDSDSSPQLTFTPLAALVGHTNRIKAFQPLNISLPLTFTSSPEPRTRTTVLATVSSDGFVHVYDLDMVVRGVKEDGKGEGLEVEPVVRYDSKGTRLTCVCVADGDVPMAVGEGKGEKRKREEEEEEEDGEGEGEEDQGEDGEDTQEDEEENEEEDEEEEEEEEEEAEED